MNQRLAGGWKKRNGLLMMMTCNAITIASWKRCFHRKNNAKAATLGLNLTLTDQICANCHAFNNPCLENTAKIRVNQAMISMNI